MDDTIIRDPLLRSVLEAANRTRDQCLFVLDFLDQNATPPSHTTPTPTPTPSTLSELNKHQKTLTSRLARLRGQYRAASLAARATKQQTAVAKSEIDSLHLHLQNLLYEQRHLKGDIAACSDYAHSYARLALVPAAQVLDMNPEWRDLDDHQLMLARIRDEHARRLALEEQRQQLLKRKHSLVIANKLQKEELDNLDKEIEKFVHAATPVQALFDAKDPASHQKSQMHGLITTL